MARQAYRPATHLLMTSPFYPLIPLFSQTCSSPNHLDNSFPHLWFLPKHPIISCLPQSPNALPLHTMMCPTPPGSNPLSPKGALTLTHRGGFHTWTIGLRLSWDSPGRGPERVSLPESVICVPVCLCPPVLLWACGDEPLMSWWLL